MRQNQIKVGGLYRAKVSGKMVIVRVDAIVGRWPLEGFRYNVTNLSTGRKTTFRTAAKFRCEYLNNPAINALRRHVSGKIESGESQPITEQTRLDENSEAGLTFGR